MCDAILSIACVGVGIGSVVPGVTAFADASPATAVNRATYEAPGSPSFYRWQYASSPLRECAIYLVSGRSAALCSVAFPAGTPAVSNPPFHGPPNAIQIVDGRVQNTITEGGPPGARALPANHSITVGAVTCTALGHGGIDCSSGARGFRFADAKLTAR